MIIDSFFRSVVISSQLSVIIYYEMTPLSNEGLK